MGRVRGPLPTAEQEATIYDDIQAELWAEREAKKCQTLTPWQIADAFGDEALDILPRIQRQLSRALKPLNDAFDNIEEKAREEKWDTFNVWFNKKVVLMFSNLESTIERFEVNKEIMTLARRRQVIKNNPTPPKVNDLSIEQAKRAPILGMFSFSKLRRYGNKHMACCPFHQEEGPSFYIYDNNTFHCFGCQANGSAVDFYMKLNNVDFKSAVIALTGA